MYAKLFQLPGLIYPLEWQYWEILEPIICTVCKVIPVARSDLSISMAILSNTRAHYWGEPLFKNKTFCATLFCSKRNYPLLHLLYLLIKLYCNCFCFLVCFSTFKIFVMVKDFTLQNSNPLLVLRYLKLFLR